MLSRASVTSLILLGSLVLPACGDDTGTTDDSTEEGTGDTGDATATPEESGTDNSESGDGDGDGDGEGEGDGDGDGDGDGEGESGTDGGGNGNEAFFLMDTINVRDPHFFVDLGLGTGCADLTDAASIGINAQLNDSIIGDVDEDDILDLSIIFSLNPWDSTVSTGDTEAGLAWCSAPIDSTECAWPVDGPSQASSFDNKSEGTCLAPDLADLSGYFPQPNTVIGECFSATMGTFDISLAGVTLPLIDVTLSAHYSGDTLTGGLLKGFLTESAADGANLPSNLPPQFAGLPVSDILLGGAANNCDDGDDRDMNGDESGWWFYVDITALEVPMTFEPPMP